MTNQSSTSWGGFQQNRQALVRHLFFLSGLCSLLYEVLWLRFFTSVLGSSTQSVSAIVTAFLAGTALGGFAVGRFVDRIDNPLRLYAILELLTGAVALVAFGFFLGFDGGSALLAGAVPYSVEKWLLFAVAFVFVAAPAALIGATLPVLSRLFITSLAGVSTHLGDLYAKNTLGAAVGAGLSVALVAVVGYFYAYATSVLLSLSIGVVALVLSRSKNAAQNTLKTTDLVAQGQDQASELDELQGEKLDELQGEKLEKQTLKPWYVATCMALSGFSALSFEIAWFRVAEYQWRGTLIGFGVLLACYLLGLSLGAKLISRRRSITGHARLFASLQVAAGWAVLAALPLALLCVAVKAVPAQLSTPFILLGVTTVFGAAFPVAGKLAVGNINVLGARIGLVYAANLLGAVLGSLLTGFVLIPTLGTQVVLFSLPIFHFGIAATVFLAVAPSKPSDSGATGQHRARPRQLLIAMAGVCLALGAHTGDWMERYVLYASPIVHKQAVGPEFRLLALEETNIQAVAVLENDDGDRILVGGSNISGTTMRRHTQTVQSHLAMLMHPNPSDVLEIGYGVGELLSTILEYDPDHVDLVEIDPRMTHLANEYFSKINSRASEASNVSVHIMDGRRFIQRAGKRYDVIMSDTMFLDSEQSLRLYTAEHFRRSYESLNENGVMLAWVPLNMQDEAIQGVIRTFISVFPRTYLWNPDSYPFESFLIGIKGDNPIDYETLVERFQRITGPSTAMFAWSSPLDFLAGFRADTESLKRFVGDGPLHRDMKPTIDFAAGGTPDEATKLVQMSPLFILEHLKIASMTKKRLRDDLVRYQSTRQVLVNALPERVPAQAGAMANQQAAESAAVCNRLRKSSPSHVVLKKVCAERLAEWATLADSPAVALERARRALEFDAYNSSANQCVAEQHLSRGFVNEEVFAALRRLEQLNPYSREAKELRREASRLTYDPHVRAAL